MGSASQADFLARREEHFDAGVWNIVRDDASNGLEYCSDGCLVVAAQNVVMRIGQKAVAKDHIDWAAGGDRVEMGAEADRCSAGDGGLEAGNDVVASGRKRLAGVVLLDAGAELCEFVQDGRSDVAFASRGRRNRTQARNKRRCARQARE